jgi:ER membrane protein complex subunit 2
MTLKRKACLYRTAGFVDKAITELNSYLEVFQDDLEVWEELTDIYLSVQNFARAAYCYEEILLNTPENFWIVLKYGEIVYSIGGIEKMTLARMYFIQALILNPKCIRAMWALYQCTRTINSIKPDPLNSKLSEKASKYLDDIYRENKVDKKDF